ncbi:RWP-RK domain-containing protein [Artemisia annua]|uniref:RWP-RK domain-containing protein n=1 Tax=Artemisia annua TaxID=35608 RepID=A0A2U1PIQ4_ARTAN|nr:RWP-RK domain-containing protein [Artemisia annua]
MACSTMSAGWTDQTRSVHWNLKVSPGEPFPPPSSKIHYIFVPTNEKVKQKIISIARNLSLPVQNVLFQCWAPKKIGNSIVLTTICQPFGLSGVNKELEVYRKGCLDHKLYVHPEQGKAVGLAGRVFLNCIHEQTQDMHKYPKDQRPPCEDAIFSRIWGSIAVPVILNGQCVLVLEFVLDTPTDSYDNIIAEVCRLLENAGLQSSIQTDCSRRICINTNINSRKRMRRTRSLPHTYYFRLVPYFGQSSSYAAEKLGIKKGTFRNVCRNVGIPEWPGLPSKNTRASSAPEIQVSQTLSDTSSFGTLIDDAISSRDEAISELREETPTTTVAFASENQVNQLVPMTSLNTNDFNSCWDGGVYKGTLELIIPTNTHALETQINQLVSNTSYTQALPDSQHDGIEYQGNETMALEDLDHHWFVDSLDYIFEDAPMMTWAA